MKRIGATISLENFYMSTSADRARLLIKQIGPKKVSLHGGNYDRWKSVSKGAIRVSTEAIDVLVKIYPSTHCGLLAETPHRRLGKQAQISTKPVQNYAIKTRDSDH